MPNITRGGRMGGLLAYLCGPKQQGGNLHIDPRMVAGDPSVLAGREGVTLERGDAQSVARLLDHPRVAFGTRVTVAVKTKGPDGEQLTPAPATDGGGSVATLAAPSVERKVKDAHVWHCSLSLRAEEGQLSDQRWRSISEDFVAAMGFTDPAGEQAPCRWISLRHGLSGGGNDHVHIVVGLVREDGTTATCWNDRPRAQQVAGELERRYGLQVLESRIVGRGGRESTPAERGIAARREAHLPPHERTGETARERLARIVRGCAAGAEDEADFVRSVVASGVRIRPRFEQGRQDVVVGYSVALRAEEGEAPDWYGGGRLARDLTLPRLRQSWPEAAQHAPDALKHWAAAPGTLEGSGRPAVEPDARTWLHVTEQVRRLREQLRDVAVDDHATWARVAHETAGAFAAWSLQTEPTPGPLAATADALARSAQLRAHQVRPSQAELPSARGAARLLAAAAHGGHGPVAQAALVVQLANTARALHDAHRASGDARRAAEIADAVRGELAHVVDQLPGAEGTPVTADSVKPPAQSGGLAAQGRPGAATHGREVDASAAPHSPAPSRPRRPDIER